MNTYKIIGNGINSVVAWNENRFEFVNFNQAADMDDLLLVLTKSGFFTSEEVKNSIKYERKNKYVLETRTGMSGCEDYKLYELRKTTLCREEFTNKMLRAKVHISCANKFNEGINCALIDFVTISFKEWGWEFFYLNPTWIEENIEKYFLEAQYSKVARYSDPESPTWLENMRGINRWWQQVSVFQISSYEGDLELNGSLEAHHNEVSAPEFINTREVERREEMDRFFRCTVWVKKFVNPSEESSDMSAWYLPVNKYRLQENDAVCDLDEVLYIVNGCIEPTPEEKRQLMDKLYDKNSVGQIPFEDESWVMTWADTNDAPQAEAPAEAPVED